jgi:hypothetical protein
VLAVLVGCGGAVVYPTWLPGEEPPVAVRLPRGTLIVAPCGTRRVLGGEAVVMPSNVWRRFIEMMASFISALEPTGTERAM